MSLTRIPRPLRLLAPLALLIVAVAGGSSALAAAPPSAPPTALSAAPPSAPPSASAGTLEELPEGYVRLVDDTGFLTVVVPQAWSMVDTVPSTGEDGNVVPDILASTVGIEEFDTTFTSGVRYFAVGYQPDPEAFIAASGLSSGCESIEVRPFTNATFIGSVQVGTNCGETGGTWNMVVASPPDQSFTAVVQLQISSSEEQDAFDQVLESFSYAADPALPPGVVVASSVPGVPAPG